MSEEGPSQSNADSGGIFPIRNTRFLSAMFYAMIFGWIMYLLVTGWEYRWSDKLFPLIIGIPTLSLIILEVVSVMYPGFVNRLVPETTSFMQEPQNLEDMGEMVEADSGHSPAEQQRVGVIMVGWVLALLIMVYLLGYAYALPIYIFAFGVYFLNDIRLAAMMTVVFNLFVYILFVLILEIFPWNGILGLPNYLRYIS